MIIGLGVGIAPSWRLRLEESPGYWLVRKHAARFAGWRLKDLIWESAGLRVIGAVDLTIFVPIYLEPRIATKLVRFSAVIHFKVSLTFEFALRALNLALVKMLVEVYLPWRSRIVIAVPALFICVMDASMMLHALRGL